MVWVICNPHVPVGSSGQRIPPGEAAGCTFQLGYTIRIKANYALQLASALNQPNNKPVDFYIAQLERKLSDVDIKSHNNLFTDSLFENDRPYCLYWELTSALFISHGESSHGS